MANKIPIALLIVWNFELEQWQSGNRFLEGFCKRRAEQLKFMLFFDLLVFKILYPATLIVVRTSKYGEQISCTSYLYVLASRFGISIIASLFCEFPSNVEPNHPSYEDIQLTNLFHPLKHNKSKVVPLMLTMLLTHRRKCTHLPNPSKLTQSILSNQAPVILKYSSPQL